MSTMRYFLKNKASHDLARVIILCFIAFWAIAANAESKNIVVRDGLSRPVRAWSRAVESGDSAALTRMNPDSATVFPPDAMVVRGTKNVVSGYTAMFTKFKAKVRISDAHYIESGNIVCSWGLYTLTLAPLAGGEPIVTNGRFSDIAVQVQGQWQYIVDHASLPTRR